MLAHQRAIADGQIHADQLDQILAFEAMKISFQGGLAAGKTGAMLWFSFSPTPWFAGNENDFDDSGPSFPSQRLPNEDCAVMGTSTTTGLAASILLARGAVSAGPDRTFPPGSRLSRRVTNADLKVQNERGGIRSPRRCVSEGRDRVCEGGGQCGTHECSASYHRVLCQRSPNGLWDG
jgi:hypothetical protein